MCGSRYGVCGLLYALCAMPANLSPEYKNAEQAFRAAREPRERLDRLKEMLRTIPKHKGTERIQADIKSRIKQFSDELIGPRKGPAQVGSAHSVHREGAAQVGLIGPPNSGKSSLHAIHCTEFAPNDQRSPALFGRPWQHC
jgi:hypothetical protein